MILLNTGLLTFPFFLTLPFFLIVRNSVKGALGPARVIRPIWIRLVPRSTRGYQHLAVDDGMIEGQQEPVETYRSSTPVVGTPKAGAHIE